jgi:hypothetical protein
MVAVELTDVCVWDPPIVRCMDWNINLHIFWGCVVPNMVIRSTLPTVVHTWYYPALASDILSRCKLDWWSMDRCLDALHEANTLYRPMCNDTSPQTLIPLSYLHSSWSIMCFGGVNCLWVILFWKQSKKESREGNRRCHNLNITLVLIAGSCENEHLQKCYNASPRSNFRQGKE